MAIVISSYQINTPFMPMSSHTGFEFDGHTMIGWNKVENRYSTTPQYRIGKYIDSGFDSETYLYACWVVGGDLSTSNTSIFPSNYTYTSQPCTPNVSVMMHEIQIDRNLDYIITYLNNINAGIGTVVISANPENRHGYFGYKEIEFVIDRSNIDSAEIEYTSTTYNGQSQIPVITDVKSGYLDVPEGQYSISNSLDTTNCGTKTILISGDVNFCGEITKTYVILPADMTGVYSLSGYGLTGTSQQISVFGYPEGSTVYYKLSVDGEYTTTNPSISSLGTTTVYYKVTNSNYNDYENQNSVVISSAETTG